MSDRVQNARGRAEKLESVRHSIRERGSRRSDQGRVWDSIAEESASLGAASPTSEMGAMFERHKDTLDDYVDMMNAAPDQLGALFIVGGRRYGLDLFDRPKTFAAFLPKLVRSYAIDVLGRRPRQRDESLEGEARSFLNRILEGTFDDHPAVGLGRDVGVVGEGLVAGALVAERTVVHLTAFAEPVGRRTETTPEASPGRRYASYRQRLDSLRSRYDR